MDNRADLSDIEAFDSGRVDVEGIDIEELDDGGAFGIVTAESSGDAASLDRRMRVLAELVSAAAAADRLLASVAAARAEAVDQVRAWCLANELAAERDRARRARLAQAAERGLAPDLDSTLDSTVDSTAESAADSEAVSAGVAGTRWDALEIAYRTAVSELACALHISQASASNLMSQSEALTGTFTAARNALATGQISYAHVRLLMEHAASLPEAARPEFEARMLPEAKRLTVAQFDREARRVREKTHPESITARRAKSQSDRTLVFEPAADGMGWLHSYQQLPVAQAIFHRVNDMAASLQGPDEPRTLAQLRADAFAALLIDGVTPAGLGRGIRATVNVTVPVLTLLGRSDEPGHLEGCGPIDPETARELAAGAPSFTRILVHPETGVMLSVGRNQYRVPKDLRRLLVIRDETCRFAGCNRPAARAEMDHTHEWQADGITRYDNLASLCAPDHRLKAETNWAVTQSPGGELHWTAPSGLHYRSEPAIPFEPPGDVADPPPF
ncbi:HNH endonuclease [Cryobacterium cryoconiti]|uniref:HNH endonuclease n=1 Tax=Cryobacterium cryoconiti TaxID=1259239 RepID=A0A4Y8JWE4_9MICO|nr:HNH endonuclease signature motif containing protein [Cryobacterium cryoconiti]TFD32981.1 HNH endonuclease [Cryobacterium cryoconiti]